MQPKKTVNYEIIRERRIKLGYSQKEFADLLGVKHYQTVSSWERGENSPKKGLWDRICKVLGISLNTLSGDNGSEAETKNDTFKDLILMGMLNVQRVEDLLKEEVDLSLETEETRTKYEKAARLAGELRKSLWEIYKPFMD